MMLEGYLAGLAIAQALVISLRAGSRALYALRHQGSIGIVEGPLILPPDDDNYDDDYQGNSDLWDLTAAFRQAVKLGLRIDEYEGRDDDSTFYTVISTVVDDDHDTQSEPYCMSLVPITSMSKAEDDQLDDEGKIELVGAENGNNEQDSKELRRSYFWCRRRKEETHLDLDFTTALVTEYALDSDRIAHITSYAPNCFSVLRSDFGVDEGSFQSVLLDSGPFVSFQSNSKGAARSGGVFFFTRDGSYIVKTIKRAEARTLLHMLPTYTDFMKDNGRRSLLTRFFGLYKICLKDESSKRERCRYIVIMNSVFPAEATRLVSERFDLKGSTVGREASMEERETKGTHVILKDLDLVHEQVQSAQSVDEAPQKNADYVSPTSQNYGLRIGPDAKQAFMSQLQMDVGLLKDCAVIDYSLLVGIASPQKDGSNSLFKSTSNQSTVHTPRPLRRGLARMVLSVVLVPFQILMAPSLFRKGGRVSAWPPLVPYFQSDLCGVDAGQLSKIPGERRGEPALYYFGLIDFLQPFDTIGKVLEYRLKGLVYEKDAYSCVPPDLYARRFLAFIDEHIS